MALEEVRTKLQEVCSIYDFRLEEKGRLIAKI
jgi:hypothetical protein